MSEPMTETIELSWPPSVNAVYRMFVMGQSPRMIISRPGRLYFKSVEILMTLRRFMRFGKRRLRVEIYVYPADRRRRDLDNLGKVVLDSLQKCGVYDDDSQIDFLSFRRMKIKKPGVVRIHITEIVK